jgi:serine/threonine-protein kinase
MSMPPSASADPERLARVFGEALDLPPGERRAFLDAACEGAPELRAETESLLISYEQAGDFMDGLDARCGAALLDGAAAPGADGRRAGPYRLLRELGRGGMGVVYLAERVEGGFEQRAAIKLLKRGMDSEAILRRFLRERQILASLEHPSVARLLDGGVTEEGQPYFAMEYVDGRPLIEYCRARGLGVEARLRLFEEACRAVQHAHGKLVVHRDLKPSNMLVTAEGRLKLLDFGIAKLLDDHDDAGGTALTQEGTRLLTPDYAAPEQVRGEPVTTATDVYALGVVLYELLTERLPHAGAPRTYEEIARAVCETDPRPPSAATSAEPRLSRRLKGDLDTVVLKALGKEPSRRYASAEALAEDVRRYLDGFPVQARRDTIGYVATKFVRRHRVGVGAAAVALASLVLGLVGTAWQARVAARERDRARAETERAEKVKEFLIGLFKASDPKEAKGETVTARELLDRGADRIEKDLDGHPALQAELFEIVGGISQELGRDDRARRLAERALDRARQAYGPEHAQVARALETLGWITYRLGDYATSEDVYRQSLAMRRRLFPATSTEVADSLDSLGMFLTARARLDEAEPLHREALAIRRRLVGDEHTDTAFSIATLASVLYARGDYKAAAEMHREALAIRRKAHGDVHPYVATSLLSLGAALVQLGDLPAAEAAYRECLGTRRRLYGDEHPLVVESLHHLAATVDIEGDLPRAEAMYREVLALDRKLKGEEHRDVAVALTSLGYALAQQGKFDEALPLITQAAAMHRRVTGADHPLLARTLQRQAWTLVEQGRARDALPVAAEAVAIYKARGSAPHPDAAVALSTAARARAALGELAQAEALFREALEIQRRAKSAPHRDTPEVLAGLGEVLLREDRPAEAEPLLREALAQADQALPPGRWERGEIESVLGACLSRRNQAEEGRRLLTTGYDRLRTSRGEGHPATRRARLRLEVADGGRPGARAGLQDPR